MKSIFIVLLAILCSNMAIAQKTPKAVTDAFNKAYAGATKVKWDKEDAQYEATFHYKNQEMSVLYNTNGTVAETETEINVNDLPAAAKNYASAKGKIKQATKIVDASGKVQYEAQVNHKDLMFDEKGNFIKEKIGAEKD